MDPNYDVNLSGENNGPDSPRADAGGAPPQQQADPSGQPQQARPQSPAPQQQGGDGAQVPSHRLREITQENRELRRQLQALSQQRSQPQAPARQEPQLSNEDREVQEAFFRIFPQFRKLATLDPEALERVVTQIAPQSEALASHYWQSHGRRALREIETHVRELYGESLDPAALRIYHTGFMAWLEENPDLQDRYAQGDPELVPEYWKHVDKALLDPVRTKAQTAARQQADRVNALPRFGGGRSSVLGQGKPQRRLTEDELHDAAFDAAVTRARG